MLRIITCQNATMLLEQRVSQPMPRPLRASLWLHLRYCVYCSRYARQTVLIADWTRAAAASRASAGPGLSDAAKERMRQRLAAAK